MSICEDCSLVEHEARIALEDVNRIVCNYGRKIKIFGLPVTVGITPNTEQISSVDRDKYGSIINKTNLPVEFNAYPIDYNPSNKQLQKIGVVEQVDATIYLSSKEVWDKGYTFKDFDVLETSVVIDDVEFKIKDKKMHSQFKNTYLYIVLGLKRS
jgi:hypothetical protein